MTRLIAGSSSLIFLAKCGLLEIVCDLFEVIVPSSMISEVADDTLARTRPEASLILDLVSEQKIRVEPSVNVKWSFPLH